MQFAELFAKVADEVLRLSGGYRIWFRQGNKGTPTARNPLSGLAEIAGNFSLSAKRAQALLQDKYEIFGKETGLDSFDTQAQVHLPFWWTSWKGFDPKDYWEIARGWQWLPAVLWAKEVVERGSGEILLTSMDADGTKAGFELNITEQMSKAVNVPVIASGGAGTMEHIKDAFNAGADAALAASIFHYKEIDIMDLKHYLHDQNIPVRL